MPIYTYMCSDCGEKEIHQSILDHRLDRCPDCNSNHFRKVICPANVSFKGTGFYSTDSKAAQ